MTRQLAAFAVLSVVGSISAPGDASGSQRGVDAKKLSVYVVANTDEHGFVEPGVPDSVRDIRTEIAKRRNLRLTTTIDSADIVLRAFRRGKFTAGQGAVAMPIGASVFALPFDTDGLHHRSEWNGFCASSCSPTAKPFITRFSTEGSSHEDSLLQGYRHVVD